MWHRTKNTKGEKTMNEWMSIRKAYCCKYCKYASSSDYHFRDAIYCNKYNKYSQNTDICDLFERNEQ